MVLSTLMKFGKFAFRLVCLSSIDGEAAMTNKMSTLRLTLTGMSLYSTRPCSGETSEMVRSGQPARRPRPRSDVRITALRIGAPLENEIGLGEDRAIRSPDERCGSFKCLPDSGAVLVVNLVGRSD